MKARLLLPVAVLALPNLHAQTTRTFSSVSGSDWRTTSNWSGATTFAGDAGGTVTGEGLATDIASFTAAYTSTNLGFNGTNLGGSLTLGAIVYNPASASGTFNSKTFGMSNTTGTLAGTLRLNGATVDSVANTLISVSSTASTGANFTITNLQPGTTSAGQTLNVVFGHANGVLNVATSRTLAFTNNGVDGASAGTGFTKTGGGTLTFGTNFGTNLTGKITLGGGQMRFQGANRTITNAIDVTGSSTIYTNNVHTTLNTGAITLSDGVTLTFNGGGGANNRFSVANDISLAGGATAANLTFTHDSSQTNTYSGVANIGSGTFTKGSSATLNVTNALTAGGITSNGSLFTISGSVTGGGSGGSLAITNSTLTSMTISGAITASSLTKGGAGTTILSGNNSNLTGDKTINAGALDVRHSGALGPSGSVVLNTGAGNRLIIGSNGVSIDRPLSLNGGGDVALGALHYSPATGTGTYAGNITVAGPTQAGGHFGSGGTGATLDLTGSITHTAVNPADRFVVARVGAVQLSGTGSDYTEMRLSEGLLRLGVDNAIPTGASLRVGDNGNPGNVSTFDLNGFNQSLSALSRNNTGSGSTSTVTNSSGTASTLTINNSANGSYTGSITGNLALVKQGSATFSLPAGTTHSFTGTTTVQGGTLAIHGTLSASAVTVQAAAVLAGAGSIGGNVTIQTNATLAPGSSIESLSVSGLSMDAGSTFAYEMSDDSATGADIVVITTADALSLAGVTLDITGADLGTWSQPAKVTLMAYQGSAISSGFTGFADDTAYFFGSNEWVLNYDDTLAGANYAGELGASTRFVTLTLIPEPTTPALGLLAASFLLRRRRDAPRS